MTLTVPGLPILKMQIRYEPDIVTIRQKTRWISARLGFDSQDQARLATAVSELARNVFQYASIGYVEFHFDEKTQTFFIKVTDEGPGISDLENILNGNFISKSGMGVGLIGSKKLMDFFDVTTAEGKGTQIAIGKTLDKRAHYIKKESLPIITEALATRPAGTAFEEIQNQNHDLLDALEKLQVSKQELSDLNRELAETNRGVVALYAELDEKAASFFSQSSPVTTTPAAPCWLAAAA